MSEEDDDQREEKNESDSINQERREPKNKNGAEQPKEKLRDEIRTPRS